MTHTQLLNHLIAKYGLKSYLELGVQSTAQNFDKIKCDIKYGVDPALKFYAHPVKDIFIIDDESDRWFKCREDHDRPGTTVQNFDLIFIDGLHHADQVQRDFENSLRCLNDGGFIVVHDVLPEREDTTHVPRDSKQWFGDVYKWAIGVHRYKGIKFFTVDTDCGCMIAWKDGEVKCPAPGKCSWEFYIDQRQLLMNIIPPSDLDKYLP